VKKEEGHIALLQSTSEIDHDDSLFEVMSEKHVKVDVS